MKSLAYYLLIVFAIIGLFGFAFSINAEEPAGKKIFVDSKCSMCHTVESVGIESKKKDAVDLSFTGSKYDAEFFVKYLNKNEKIDEKEHKTSFKGSEEDLKALAEWLGTLKTDEASEEKKAE